MKLPLSIANLFLVQQTLAGGLRKMETTGVADGEDWPESLMELTKSDGPGFEDFPEPAIAKKKFYIYLAGPEVFLPNAVEAGEIGKAACASINQPEWDFEIEGMYPLDKAIENFGVNLETALRIYYANVDLIQQAHFTAANMVRFRGPSMDVGTAFEMGFTRALGKPVFGYYDAVPFYGAEEKAGTYQERVHMYNYTASAEDRFDKDGLEVEGFGGSDNLMMWGAMVDSEYPFAANVKEACMHAAEWVVAHGQGSMGGNSTGTEVDVEVEKSP